MKLEYGKQYVTNSGDTTPPLQSSKTNATHKFSAWITNPDSSSGLIRPAWNEQGQVAPFWDGAKLDLVKEYELPQ